MPWAARSSRCHSRAMASRTHAAQHAGYAPRAFCLRDQQLHAVRRTQRCKRSSSQLIWLSRLCLTMAAASPDRARGFSLELLQIGNASFNGALGGGRAGHQQDTPKLRTSNNRKIKTSETWLRLPPPQVADSLPHCQLAKRSLKPIVHRPTPPRRNQAGWCPAECPPSAACRRTWVRCRWRRSGPALCRSAPSRASGTERCPAC